jgi:O-6-methylguanine DNA methyltransferase
MPRRSFRTRVLAIVSRIPRGKTLTYGDVAGRAGNARAARAVGAILTTNYNPNIPCHRVIRLDGTLGGYNRGEHRKRELLMKEGAL